MRDSFFNSTDDIKDGLEKIDPSKYQLDFGAVLSGEEVVGEMNDFEKRAVIWMSLLVEKMKEDLRHHKDHFKDLESSQQAVREAEEENEKMKLLRYCVSKSIVERFGSGKNLALRANCLVVVSNRSEKEITDEINRLRKEVMIEIAITLNEGDVLTS